MSTTETLKANVTIDDGEDDYFVGQFPITEINAAAASFLAEEVVGTWSGPIHCVWVSVGGEVFNFERDELREGGEG